MIYDKVGYSIIFFFKMQILKFSCKFIWRTLWTHLLYGLFSVICYLPPCCSHCGSSTGSLLNCGDLPHGTCFWVGFCPGSQWHWTICSGRKLTAAVEVNESSTTLEQGQESQSSGCFHGGLLQSWCVSDWMRWKHIWMGQGIHMHKDLFLFIYLLICIIFNLLLVH